MNRSEFMAELRKLLVSIPEDDREEALQYYEDYFEDAGSENEEHVIKELGSPEKVASIIWMDAREGSQESGEFTETGYTDVRFEEKEHLACRENPVKASRKAEKGKTENAYSYRENSYATEGQGVGSGSSETSSPQEGDGYGQSGNGYGQGGSGYGQNGSDYGQGGSSYGQSGSGYARGGQRYRQGRHASGEMRTNKTAKVIMIAVLVILVLRAFGWLVPAAFSVIFGIVGGILGLLGCLVGFAFAGIGIAVAGIVLLVVGIGGLVSMFASAILLIGVGLLMLGLGVAFFIVSVKLCTVVYPALFRLAVNLVRKIFVRREVA